MPLKVGTVNIIRLYCTPGILGGVGQPRIEMLQYRIGSTLYHSRIVITFNANGGSGGSTQTRTWGVETTTQPSNPSRTGYTFLGWSTYSGATESNVTFPRATPSYDVTYYAVWQIAVTPRTVTPLIVETTYIVTYIMDNPVYGPAWKVQNKDNSGYATIWGEVGDSTPDVSLGSIHYLSYTTTQNMTAAGTVYAKAQASGELVSSTTSKYIDLTV